MAWKLSMGLRRPTRYRGVRPGLPQLRYVTTIQAPKTSCRPSDCEVAGQTPDEAPNAVGGPLSLFAAPSLAQGMTTLQYILVKRVAIHTISRQGQPLEMHVTYKADGTSTMTAMGHELRGKWRVDGDQFCTVNAMNPVEACFDMASCIGGF